MADSIGMMFIARSMKRRVIVYHIPSFFQDGSRIVDTANVLVRGSSRYVGRNGKHRV